MSDYIEREAFLADKQWLYCTDCDKRKGKKRGKMVTLYEIGEAPCKSCGIHDMLEEVEAYPAADVASVRHGRWIRFKDKYWAGKGGVACSECRYGFSFGAYFEPDGFKFCPKCGAMMDKAIAVSATTDEEDDGA